MSSTFNTLAQTARLVAQAIPRRPGLPRLAALGLIAMALEVALSGCSPIEPWVKPYEREHFADPIMAFNRDPVSSVYREHVFESREGARGATGGVGGGCGCN
ncbi:MAG TPA: DUF4266 domain-containing protein [Steroidobacteraceae bacterium]|nr:DUF4266 domain-containing protein [Steroidobacteraceae bacterium]